MATLSVKDTVLAEIAAFGDVVSIEQYVAPIRHDEVQNQILAGSLLDDGSAPSGPGYGAFLSTRGFSTNPQDYPIVAVVDDGVGDGGTAAGAGDATLTVDRDGITSRVTFARNCSLAPSAAGIAGHGHLNASVVGGFDQRAGFPFRFPGSYLRGQGVNPFARIANVKVFNNSGVFELDQCGGTHVELMAATQNAGVVISNNSWGANVGGDYNQAARDYDIGTRDADPNEPGAQPMLFVFSAGNAGPGARTVGAPGTAKNVLTVGASENARAFDEDGAWTDGCFVAPSGSDDAMDVAAFSSRGPAQEGDEVLTARIKPELIAPGTHVTATASPAGGYNGSGICDRYRPDAVEPNAQTTFAASSGTSHSAPAVAGAASLAYRFLQTQYGVAAPSPAMLKAYLAAHTTYLTGQSANDTLPSAAQGFGMPNLAAAFAQQSERIVLDQAHVMSGTGQAFELPVVPADPTQPVRIVLVFSDAPGLATADPVVNDLDLSVTRSGATYLGNRFVGAYSTPGGAADRRNTTEAIYLPAGEGPMIVRVVASNVAGDAVPGNADATDQDFALVCSNCANDPTFTLDVETEVVEVCRPANARYEIALGSFAGFASPVALSIAGLPAGASASFAPAAVAPPARAALTVTPGAAAAGQYPLTVTGTANGRTRTDAVVLGLSTVQPSSPTPQQPATGTTGVSFTPTLTWAPSDEAIDYLVEVDDDPFFASPALSATTTQTQHIVTTPLGPATTYYWRVRARNHCGESLSLVASLDTGIVPASCPVFASADVPKTLGPDAGVVASSVLDVTGLGAMQIADLDVSVRGTHSYVGDLRFELVAPDASVVRLVERRCGGASDFDMTLDDASNPFPSGACAMTGGRRFRPEQPLSGAYGAAANGAWTLRVTDHANFDGGSLAAWSLRICQLASAPITANDDRYDAVEDDPLVVGGTGVLGNDAPAAGLTVALLAPPTQGTVELSANGALTYTPAADYCGNDVFRYQASDGTNTDTARVDIVVDCVADPPVARADAYVANEDEPLAVPPTGVLGNDTDADASPLIASNATQPANGGVTLASDGSFVYLPVSNYCNERAGATPDAFTYVADDGAAVSAPASVSVTVRCVDDAPVGAADTYAATEDTPLTIAAPGVLANDTDVDAEPLSASFGAAVNGSLQLSTSGGFVYTPRPDYCSTSAPDMLSYRLTDGRSSILVAGSLAVACVNDAPRVAAAVPTQLGRPGFSFDLQLAPYFVDVDGDALSYAVAGLPPGLALEPSGRLAGTLAGYLAVGSIYAIDVSAADPSGLRAIQRFALELVAPDVLFANGYE